MRRPNGTSRLLLVSRQEHPSIQRICEHLKLELECAPDLPTALLELRRSRCDVVLYDQDLPSGDWRIAVSLLAEACPRSSIILLTHLRQPELWNEVIRRGGHDLLSKPIAEADAESTVALAIARAKLTRAS